jgi:FtsP/CotA-like multicopper oxidase with cupredoxin domain
MERLHLLLSLLLSSGSVLGAAEQEFFSWEAYVTPLKIPPVIDMREGGHLDMEMKNFNHHFGAGLALPTHMYGFSALGEEASFPGPTILVQKDVPLSITWHNSLQAPHILDKHVARDLLMHPSSCYPACGVPAVTHVHGMEVPPSSDGLPYQSIYQNQSRTDTYPNSQMASTHVYHDHAMGLTRLNHWSGLVGGYIIQDPKLEAAISTTVDVPLIITDTLVSISGDLLYPDSPCSPLVPEEETKWAPESFGSVNLVNGVVLPFLEVPQQMVRLRFVNGANSRNFGLNIPFFSDCTVVAKDMSLVNEPYALAAADEVLLYPLERLDLLCDFSETPLDTQFNVTDWSYTAENKQAFEGILQLRVASPGEEQQQHMHVPRTLNRLKNLRALYEEAPGAERHLTLDEEVDQDGCPLKLVIKVDGEVSSFENRDAIQCMKGDVERWNFHNPTADVHPFHWHAIAVQCGADDASVDSNALKDTVQIPNAEDEDDAETVTQVCYVACTPNDFLLRGSRSSPSDFKFPTKEPYVVHCHMLEHEENAMMTYFFLADKDKDKEEKEEEGEGEGEE